MSRKATQQEGALILRKSKALTDVVLQLTNNPADYITVLLLVLGNGVAAFAQEESDAEFAKKLARTKQVLDNISRDARQRLIEDEMEVAAEETKH